MDVERLKTAEKGPETPEQYGEVEAAASAERAPQQSEQDVAAAVAERKRAVEHAARSRQEMKDPFLARMESLISAGLADEYATLSEAEKKVFRKEGEAIAVWVCEAIAQNRVKPHEILDRIERWLLMIEGKNRNSYWLTQEAYIRARRMLEKEVYSKIGH